MGRLGGLAAAGVTLYKAMAKLLADPLGGIQG